MVQTFLMFQVDFNNLEEYISLVVDATVKTGIMRQMEAFRAGFNQVSYLYWFICLGGKDCDLYCLCFNLFSFNYTLSLFYMHLIGLFNIDLN